jgi:hypothetical protein
MKDNSFSDNSSRVCLISIIVVVCFTLPAFAQQRRIPKGGRLAIVVDERLSALRQTPNLSARLVERLSRGRFVAIIATTHDRNGVTFYRVKATRRRSGWIQSDAVVSASQPTDSERLMRLIRDSKEFELVARARIFLDAFVLSPMRPTVLLLYGDTAEGVSDKLSNEAARRLDEEKIAANGAPQFTYFMNFNGLDRYNRQGVKFVFDHAAKRFHYDGAAWRELVQRYPNSPEAAEARQRLDSLAAFLKR